MNTVHIPESPWTESAPHTLKSLQVDPDTGLSPQQVRQRQKKFGLNQLKKAKKKDPFIILVRQFKSILILLLVAAAVLSFVFGKVLEGSAISVVIVINAAIGFYTELRAIRSMEALYQLTQVTAKVLRDSTMQQVPASQLVPGDIIIAEAGDIITADTRIVEASRLQVDESALTGESYPVSKSINPIKKAPLAERSNMLYKGTALTRGSAKGVVVATGEDTELGRISALIKPDVTEETQLEKRLEQLGQNLVWVTLAIAGVVAVSGIVTGKDIFLMIETAIALAVATVPEGLPMVATLALARGMWKMARRNALVNRLSAVETLGSTTVICTDKTGTLTENQMTVTEVAITNQIITVSGTGLNDEGSFTVHGKNITDESANLLKKALEISVLCNNASLDKSEEVTAVGDPTEVALLVAGKKAEITRDKLIKDYPEIKEVSFDPAVNMMATYHENNTYVVAVKGAPEAVLDASSHCMTQKGRTVLKEHQKEKWLRINETMGSRGLRVLAVATKHVHSPDEPPYQNLTFVGLLGLLDPPREEVNPSIKACQNAGIIVVMVTGDHAATARTVAAALHIVDEDASVLEGKILKNYLTPQEKEAIVNARCFARVSPEQKLTLVTVHQDGGAVVAMTGDGINDAPALKKADIGVAMGQRGTQVAREAADMILQDDNFSTITNAVEEGRIIFSNIRKFVFYLLSCNISEILIIFLASLMNVPLPVLPLQILFLNVVTDIFPAFALGGGEGSHDIMENPPRNPEEPILTHRHWTSISLYSVVITASVLGAFFFALYSNIPVERVVTISFLTLAFSQLLHVFNMRNKGSPFIKNEITTNVYVWGALGLCTILLLVVTYVPGLSVVLKTVDPGVAGWGIIMSMSSIPWVVGQIWNSGLYKIDSKMRIMRV